jgi:hypothetical protein
MAELKGNGLWDDIQTKGDSALDQVLGPSYEYAGGIQTPSSKGVGNNGDLGQIITNSFAVGDYVKDLITGPGDPYGNQVFVQTGGMCKAPNGGVVPRWSFINNKLGGEDALTPKMKAAIGQGGMFNGIIPGMFGDIASLNPIKMMNALYLSGVPDCRAITCQTTDVNGTRQNNQTHFLVPEFEANLGVCSVADAETEKNLEDAEVEAAKKLANPEEPVEAEAEPVEAFGGGFTDVLFQKHKPNRLYPSEDCTVYALALAALVFFIGKHAFRRNG